MTRQTLAAAGAVLVIGLLVLWMFTAWERVPERTWVGFRGEARDNPWLAAQRLLERMGRPARLARSVPQLQGVAPDGVLLMGSRLASLDATEQRRILEWVERGGHLVVEAEPAGRPDPVLDAVGVGRRMLSREGRRASPARGAGTDDGTVEARHAAWREPLRVQMGRWSTLEATDPLAAFVDGEVTWAVHVGRGAGRITAISQLGFASNLGIGRHDHAEFLWRLVQFGPQGGPVAFFHSPRKLSLAEWLLENAWTVLASAALLLAAWLWRVVPRFGPVAPDPEPARRRLLDHLRASGRFQWAAGGRVALAEAARDAVLRRLYRAHPDFAALGAAEREARLASLFGLSPQQARAVLHPVAPATPADLVAATATYQTIHERLTIAKESA